MAAVDINIFLFSFRSFFSFSSIHLALFCGLPSLCFSLALLSTLISISHLSPLVSRYLFFLLQLVSFLFLSSLFFNSSLVLLSRFSFLQLVSRSSLSLSFSSLPRLSSLSSLFFILCSCLLSLMPCSSSHHLFSRQSPFFLADCARVGRSRAVRWWRMLH